LSVNINNQHGFTNNKRDKNGLFLSIAGRRERKGERVWEMIRRLLLSSCCSSSSGGGAAEEETPAAPPQGGCFPAPFSKVVYSKVLYK
jgi:hypothetical protein